MSRRLSLQSFGVDWRLIADLRVPPVRMVRSFDVLKQVQPCLGVAAVDALFRPLTLSVAKKPSARPLAGRPRNGAIYVRSDPPRMQRTRRDPCSAEAARECPRRRHC